MNNDALYDILKIDEKSGVIKSDYRSIKMQQDRLSKLSNIDITVTDLFPILSRGEMACLKDFPAFDFGNFRQTVVPTVCEFLKSQITAGRASLKNDNFLFVHVSTGSFSVSLPRPPVPAAGHPVSYRYVWGPGSGR